MIGNGNFLMEIAISNNDLEFRTGILELIFEAQRFGTYNWDGNCSAYFKKKVAFYRIYEL